MHMHVHYICIMRTTIDIPASLRRKLINEAVKKNLKGYSPIIVEALEKHFHETQSKTDIENLRRLRGSLSNYEYNRVVQTWKEGRNNWKI